MSLVLSPVFSQDQDSKMKQIAQELVSQLSNQKVKELAFLRLEYSGSNGSEIGKYFADELSFILPQQRVNFGIIPVSQAENAMAQHQAKQQQKAANQSMNSTTSQPATSNNANNNGEKAETDWLLVGGAAAVLAGVAILSKDKKPLPKVTHFISGTIVDRGDELEVAYTVTNKKQHQVAASKRRFLKTPDITSILNAAPTQLANVQQLPYTTPGGGGVLTSPPPTGASWRNNSIVMEMKSCTQTGQNIECRLRVTARDNDVKIVIYRQSTILFAAENSNEFIPFEVVIGDQFTVEREVDKTLIAKHSADIVLRFTKVNQRIRNIAALKIHGYDSIMGYYTADFNSIPVY